MRFRELRLSRFGNWTNYRILRAGIPGVALETELFLKPFSRIPVTFSGMSQLEGLFRELRNPRLPPFLNEVTLRNLRLNHSAVDLMLRRHGNDVSLQVLRNEGQIRVAAVYS